MESKIKVGSKVKYLGWNGRQQCNMTSPKVGTIGEVISTTLKPDPLIKWPDGSTSGNDIWYCSERWLEVVEEPEAVRLYWNQSANYDPLFVAIPKKFKTVKELVDAYKELEKEFTKKCQEFNSSQESIIQERENWMEEFNSLQERYLEAAKKNEKLKRRLNFIYGDKRCQYNLDDRMDRLEERLDKVETQCNCLGRNFNDFRDDCEDKFEAVSGRVDKLTEVVI